MNLINFFRKLNFILFFISTKNNSKILNKNASIQIIKSFNKNLRLFDKINYVKSKRFDKKNLFIVLKDKNNFIGSGWIYFGKRKWRISEIDKTISIQNYYLLYDFMIIKKYRNMGYYADFLKLIKKNFFRSNLCIYTTLNNFYSFKGIKSSGFSLNKIISKFFILNL
jgi:hypothetical protein